MSVHVVVFAVAEDTQVIDVLGGAKGVYRFHGAVGISERVSKDARGQ